MKKNTYKLSLNLFLLLNINGQKVLPEAGERHTACVPPSTSPAIPSSRGIAGDIVKQISSYLAFDGLVKARESSYSNKTKYLLVEQSDLDKKMAAIQTRYTQQFSTMSKIMDEMKATQDYLKSSLGNLPFTSKND